MRTASGDTTASPSFRPEAISTIPWPRRPRATGWRSAWPPRTTSTHGDPSASRTRSPGRTSAEALRATSTSIDTVMSGRRNVGGSSTISSTSMVPRAGSTAGARRVMRAVNRLSG